MITVSNLKKSFDAVDALKGISFNIAQGECYGLLGPNGAGKTTTISILSTIINPNEGEVKIAGYDLKKNPLDCKKNIGVVTQEIALYNELSAYDNLLFWGGLYKVPRQELSEHIDETLGLLGLTERKNDKVKTYSGGMKRRINIASALLHKPKILFMDEPTVGIDPQSRNLIFEVVEKLHEEGMTIIYTTHYMEEAERLCDRVGIIDNGEIIAQGTLNELKNSGSMKESVVISYTNLTDECYQTIEKEWKDLRRFEDTIHFYSMNIQGDLSKLILMCNEFGLDMRHIDIQKINLETIFLNLTGKQLRDK
ncbi:MAG: ATP-binding cassette domain-containing protein [Bacteroidales bacterium]|nr:ATP-binding cassette domain-containing protein [Bacteroidales bacterium]